jgi:hypothetical protein
VFRAQLARKAYHWYAFLGIPLVYHWYAFLASKGRYGGGYRSLTCCVVYKRKRKRERLAKAAAIRHLPLLARKARGMKGEIDFAAYAESSRML